ncbi:MAG: nucleotidyltransferase family protein [Candidatus Omnitrophica bacterium]|nr:nucleotidyltransferase family protein [Candidatus Omnitrophota bacterium]
MIGVLLAGGEGRRLKPLTDTIPKAMAVIAGKPVLEHNLDLLAAAGITESIVSVYYKKEKVIEYFTHAKKNITQPHFHVQERLRGSAGDLKDIRADIRGPFVVMYADNFSNCNLKPVLKFHALGNQIATIVLFHRDRNKHSGIAGGCVRFDQVTHAILEFIEGEGAVTPFINAGIYVVDPKILQFIPDEGTYDFGKDLFPALIQARERLAGYLMPQEEFLFGLDTLECYEQAVEFTRSVHYHE